MSATLIASVYIAVFCALTGCNKIYINVHRHT